MSTVTASSTAPAPRTGQRLRTITTQIPSRLDRLPWSRFHWRIVIGLGTVWVPVREPPSVELRARLRPGITPIDVDHVLRDSVKTPMRGPPNVTLEEVDGDDIVVRVRAVPERPSDGPRLASEVLAAITRLTPRRDL